MSKPIQPIPYLAFDGNCKEALKFYADVLGGTFGQIITFGDVPETQNMPDEYKSRVMNGRVDLAGGMLLYGGDCPPGAGMPHGVMIALQYDTTTEAEGVFHKLAEEGQINVPFAGTFWARGFGMLTDRFGISWAVNGEML